MRWASGIGVLVFSLLAVAEPSADYAALKQRVLAGEASADFRSFRYATVEQPGFDPWFSVSEESRYLLGDILDGDPTQAASTCSEHTVNTLVSIQLHLACRSRLTKLGNLEAARLHEFIAQGLLDSLAPDAGGIITVITASEQYDYALANEFRLGGHRSLKRKSKNGERLSSLELIAPDGASQWVIFEKHPGYERFQETMWDDALKALTEEVAGSGD